jgi:hypothetical protein
MNSIEAARAIATSRHVTGSKWPSKSGALEIDPGCEVAAVTNGIWVQAWVFVADADIKDMLAEEEEDARFGIVGGSGQ